MNPRYNEYTCLESFFSKQRGCQYPWNVYEDLNITVCPSYGTVAKMLHRNDLGYKRDKLETYERLAKTGGECTLPCDGTSYNVKIEKWEDWRTGRSLQISFTDFMIRTEEQYLACDVTCIIGELGGNLGFFLGGSLLIGFNAIVEYSSAALNFFYMAWQNRNPLRA